MGGGGEERREGRIQGGRKQEKGGAELIENTLGVKGLDC